MIPAFTRENIELTVKQMYPGSKVIWAKANGKKQKAIILIYGDKEPEDLVPVAVEGNLMQIAKTLVTMFACCQHFVLQRIKQEVAINKMDEKAQIVSVSGAPIVAEERQSSIVLPG
jgi:hypothetical protein